MKMIPVLAWMVGSVICCFSQTNVTKEFGSKYDFSKFLFTDADYGVDGVYDDTFHRIQFAFTKVEKSASDQLLYKVEGADRLKGLITRFNGEIRIIEIIRHEGNIYHPDKTSEDKWIVFKATFELREDKQTKGSGVFKGTLSFGLTFKREKFIDNLWEYEGDGFSNFIYNGSWTSYLTGKSKKCIWGQGKLPDTGDFDSGVGMRVINKKYQNNGWATDKQLNLIDNPKRWWSKQ
jgi:hypothetical protein